MYPQTITFHDESNMAGLVASFASQIREGLAIGEAVPLRLNRKAIDSIVLSGMGGSAIGGDLLRSYLAGMLTVPFHVNRSYSLPAYVGRRSLVIISSYSGATEETLAAHKDALKRGAHTLCITSGGQVARTAKRTGAPLFVVPGGLPPRAALGYSFFPLLVALGRMGFVPRRPREIRETLSLVERLQETYANHTSPANTALHLARQMAHRLTVIYTASDLLEAVGVRWRGQMNENAKTLAFGHVLPEMNHNELVGWKTLKDLMREIQVVVLRDRDDHRRTQRRIEVTKGMLSSCTPRMTEVWSEGTTRLARMFSLVYLADWVSLYLAALHGEDPMPVAAIDTLKAELGKLR